MINQLSLLTVIITIKLLPVSITSLLLLCFSFHLPICPSSSSALSTCLTLSHGTWRPSPWSRCSSIPPTILESQATSATLRLPPSGTTKRWPQTGTGSTPARRPNRAASALWHRTASPETHRLPQLEPRGTNSDTETRDQRERDSRLRCHVHTVNVMCTHTWKDTWTTSWHIVHSFTHTQTYTHTLVSEWITAELRCQSILLPDEGTLRRGRRGEEQNLGRGPAGLWQKLYLFPMCPFTGHVETVTVWENLSSTWKTANIICRRWKQKNKQTKNILTNQFLCCLRRLLLFKKNRCVVFFFFSGQDEE